MTDETAEEQLARLRRYIDAVDEEIVMLLHERNALIEQIGQVKKKHGIGALQEGRYKEMLEHLHAKAKELHLEQALIDDVWDAIHKHSVARQQKMK